MLSNPKYGWCNFTLGDFRGNASYITDVPNDTLDCFINYHIFGNGMVYFDGEDPSFYLIIGGSSTIYLIEEKDKIILHDFSSLTSIEKLEDEMLSDLESNIDGWMNGFNIDLDDEEKIEYAESLRKKIDSLRNLRKPTSKWKLYCALQDVIENFKDNTQEELTMLTAKEAREISIKNEKDLADKEFEDVLKSIEIAANKGLFSICINRDYLRETVASRLRELGYNLELISESTKYYRVKWGDIYGEDN